jgi:hypothetical protein
MSDGALLSLQFMNTWNVPVLSGDEPLAFGAMTFSHFGEYQYTGPGTKNTIEHFYNYEYKDSIIGFVGLTPTGRGMDHLIIRKENQDIFVEMYDEVTGEYFKNEYSLSELIPHLKELHLREMEARMRYFDKVANKSELEITPEITEILVRHIQSMSEIFYSNYGIKNRAQLDNLQFEKPIPMYILENENIIFTGIWQVPVMSDGEPLLFEKVRLEEDGQYRWAGGSSVSPTRSIHNYEHKDLIIGFLGVRSSSGEDYLMIRKGDKDIYVQTYDYATHECFKNEFALNEIINLLKK